MTRSVGPAHRLTSRVVALVIWLSLTARAEASNLAPGAYVTSGHTIYIGVRRDLPDLPSNDFFDPPSQRTGELQATRDLRLRRGILEEPRVIEAPQGRLGFSLYYADEGPRAAVILVHGNDPEAREMGFIILMGREHQFGERVFSTRSRRWRPSAFEIARPSQAVRTYSSSD